MASADLCSEAEWGLPPALLVVPQDRGDEDPMYTDHRRSVERDNALTQEKWDRDISARGAVPLILNGDFNDLYPSGLPVGWVLVGGSPTYTTVTSSGYGNGIQIGGTVTGTGIGMEYQFNVKPCTRYTLVFDCKGQGKVRITRGSGSTGTLLGTQALFNIGTTEWVRSSINGPVNIVTAKAASTDTSLRVQILKTVTANDLYVSQVQLWEGAFPRPFQDVRQLHSVMPVGALAMKALTPAQITGNQNDYNPSGLISASFLRLDTDAARNVTGIAGGHDGKVLVIANVGANNLVLQHLNAGSSAANQMQLAASADITLTANDMVTLIYDATTQVWRQVSAVLAV